MFIAVMMFGCLPDKRAENDYIQVTAKDTTVTDGVASDTQSTDANPVDSKVTDSKVTDSKVTDSKVTDSKVTDSKVTDSKVTDSKVTDSKVTDSGGIADAPDTGFSPSDCNVNTWAGCPKGSACQITPKSKAPACAVHGSKGQSDECNPFNLKPDCGRSKQGRPLRCHPMYRRCMEICAPGVQCQATQICDNTPPFENFPLKSGHCLDTCKGKCGANMNTSICYCDSACAQVGDCCPDFTKACPSIKPISQCSTFNWYGCSDGESCIPKAIYGKDGSLENWAGECVKSGSSQANQFCDPKVINSCAKSPSLGPQICHKGKCSNTCSKDQDCPPSKKCEMLDLTNKTYPNGYGACK
ncbi:MAG TPA: hypothetical protein DCQ06_07760 [Myxococcales bacterium]|nr:hypothetical protein [Myxococcales bacterium]HAN31478.1 hypothetical protein [Myxococcales bacterium]